MITIKITNPSDLVKREKGRIIAKFAPLFIDIQAKVEEVIAEEIRKAFKQNKIDAQISVISEE